VIDRPITFAAAGFVIAGEHGDAFEQGGFAGPVLTDDDRDRTIEAQLKIVMQQRQAERISLAISDLRRFEPDPLEIRRRQIDRAVAS
jgi:hypothetical protein